MTSESGMAGVILVELIFALVIIAMIAAQSVTSFVVVRASQDLVAAKLRVRQVSTAVAAEAICNATTGCVPGPALMATIPAAGSVVQFGYTFTMTVGVGTWNYTATPASLPNLGSVFVDQTGVVRCSLPNQVATVASPPCVN